MATRGALVRRSFLAAAMALAAGVSGCHDDDADDAMSASAARGNDRRAFVDSVAWTELDGLTAVLVFTPYHMTDDMRRAVLEAHSVYPALPENQPVLEMRLEIKPGRRKQDLKINTRTLHSVQFTFWYFDEPTPVVRVENSEAWPASADIEVVNLDGEMRKGGWAVGTVRARQIHTGSRNTAESYLVNLKFAASL